MELLTVQQASSKTIQVALLKELKIRPFDVSLLVQYAEFLKVDVKWKLSKWKCICFFCDIVTQLN